MSDEAPAKKIRPLPYTLGSWGSRGVALALYAMIGLLLFPQAMKYVDGWERYPYLRNPMSAQAWLRESAGGAMRQYVPTQIGGKDRTTWIMLIGIFLASLPMTRLSRRLAAKAEDLQLQLSVDDWKLSAGLSVNAKVAKELNEKLAALREGKSVDREELLKLFAETKRKLEGMAKDVAFLSIDIVGSTKMKIGEDQMAIEHDFREYKTFMTGIFQANGVLKAAWTPDGQMVCFPTLDTAIKAGKDVLRSLGRFNREIKLMKTDFTVRCGINAGRVSMDEKAPLEEVSDRVIDITGHMQKHAETGTIWIGKPIIEPVNDIHKFKPIDAEVDGYPVYVWRDE